MMSIARTTIEQVEGWTLFAWIMGLTSIAMLMLATTVDLSTGAGTVWMIRTSVRFSAPWVILAFAASSLLLLFPNDCTRWLMRNRRIIGLSFAACMGWQLIFIAWMLVGHREFYLAEIHPAGALPSRLSAYVVLLAMTVTSFATPRRMIGPKAWRILHKGGIYFMWLAICGSYTGSVFMEDDPPLVGYVYSIAGLVAWLLRIAAYFLRRTRREASRVGRRRRSILAS